MAPVSADNSPTLRSPSSFIIQDLPIQALDFQPAIPAHEMEFSTLREVEHISQDSDSRESAFFDLQPPASSSKGSVRTEDIMARLISIDHLNLILGDHVFFYRFSAFLNRYNAHLVPTLIRYLEMRKAIKAIEYANALARKIPWPSLTDFCKFTRVQAGVVDSRFDDYASRELLLLCSEALPAFITHTLIGVVTDYVSKSLTGQAVPVVQDLVGNLAEVFCLTDPSVHDNPIVYASEEFHRTTQYGTTFAIDRNCRFLQGPATDKNCTLRIAQACSLGRESNEILLNYRRDGTPFVNLLMCAPLYDDKGVVRYFIGAQIDVTGLVENGMGIESFRVLLQKDKIEPRQDREESVVGKYQRQNNSVQTQPKEALTKLQELSMMFSQEESDIASKSNRSGDDDTCSITSGFPTSIKNRNQARRIIGDEDPGSRLSLSQLNIGNGGSSTSLPGVYKHYILVRPHPSLQIIFVSPSLRLPGLLRTHFFSKLGGSAQTMSALEDAFRDGASVTAKILWLPKNSHVTERGRGAAEAKSRWIRCTPLLGSDDRVGVWMVIIVPAEVDNSDPYRRRDRSISMTSEMEAERKKFDAPASPGLRIRREQSIDSSYDGGFGLKKRTVRPEPMLRKGSVDGENQLYAEYMRGTRASSSAGRHNDRTRD